MKFNYTNLDTCSEADGLVMVIDVIRAFTNAAFAFSRGAMEIYPVSKVEEALEFKAQYADSLACGEVDGIPPEGFDFGNSPSQVLKLDLTGKKIVQRTGAGTQGVVRSLNAGTMLAASFVVAGATHRYIQKLQPDCVTFVVTGQTFTAGGDEDLSCANYLEELLKGNNPDPVPYLERVRNSNDAKIFYDPSRPEFPSGDIDHCTSLDRFDFVMLITKEDGRQVMRTVKP